MKKLIFSTVVGMFAVASVAAASSLNQAQIDAILGLLRSFGAEESVIANVQISLTDGGPITPPTQWCHTFNVNLKIGDQGDEVEALRYALLKDQGSQTENFDDVFNEFVASWVVFFQEKYKSEILTPSGLARGTGYVGPATRKKLNQLYGCVTKIQQMLTQEEARALVLKTWGGCTPDACASVTVTVQNNNGQYIVTAIYDGLRDDSTRAQKKVAPVYYSNNTWTLGSATVTQRCQPGRGHQDFSSVLCF